MCEIIIVKGLSNSFHKHALIFQDSMTQTEHHRIPERYLFCMVTKKKVLDNCFYVKKVLINSGPF